MDEGPVRNEQDIFNDLAALCASPGYIHAIALLCARDNVIHYSETLTGDDISRTRTGKELIATEVATLIGLMVKAPIDYAVPSWEVLESYVSRTDKLLEGLHDTFRMAWGDFFTPEAIQSGDDPFMRADVLREPIFYGGESAYPFQYLAFSVLRYASDNDWLRQHKGFSIDEAAQLAAALKNFLNDKHQGQLEHLRRSDPSEWTMLPVYTFAPAALAEIGGISPAAVDAIVDAFAMENPQANKHFDSLSAFNAATATPLIRKSREEVILLQYNAFVQALYETPIYWMTADTSYAATALKHRGMFTESFASDRFESVFGKDNVFRNIRIFASKEKELGEIDTLVRMGHIAIVLQAKSKRLTIEARRGNDLQLRDDFKKAVQSSYDQAHLCALAILDRSNTLVGKSGRVQIPSVKIVYPICLVSDHYPALAFQARQFLTVKSTEGILQPTVLDVFALDAILEMLDSPLRVLSYLQLRAMFGDRLHAMHELTLLSFHLKQNLWVQDDVDFVALDESISSDLDAAMMVRREGISGEREPSGILTRIKGTAVDRLIDQAKNEDNEAAIDLGLCLLQLSESTTNAISSAIEKLADQTLREITNHDATMGMDRRAGGITIHCNYDADTIAEDRLRRHCELRKYSQKADRWFGIVLDPASKLMRIAAKLEFPWRHDENLDRVVDEWNKAKVRAAQPKTGRNASCPCGSGRKFKRCCGANA